MLYKYCSSIRNGYIAYAIRENSDLIVMVVEITV